MGSTVIMLFFILSGLVHICFLFYVARNEGIIFMLCCLFIPFFSLYIYYRNWDDIKWLFPLHMGPFVAAMALG